MPKRTVYSRSFPEAKLLEWILSGELTVHNISSHDPVVVHRGRKRKPYISKGRRNPRYTVKIHSHYDNGVRYIRSIMRSKLVWMVVHKRLVPEGCVIHHKDEDRFNDAWHNLECSTDEEHKEYHYGNSNGVPF
jgi:hypothetical protein